MDPTQGRPAGESRLDFKGKRFPTYFRLSKGNERRTAHLGQRFKVQFETDAENSYLTRQQEPGAFTVALDQGEAVDCVVNLMNGIATANVRLPEGAAVGQRLVWRGQVDDPSRVDPFQFMFERDVQAPAVEPPSKPGRRKQPPEPDQPGDRQNPNRLGLPPITSVRKPDWGLHGFDSESALSVKANPSGGYDFFVNLDNKYLLTEVRSWPSRRPALEAQFKYGMVLFGLAALRHLKATGSESEAEEDFVRSLSVAFGPFLIPMIGGLAQLDELPEPTEPEED